MAERVIEVLPDAEALARAAAEHFVRLAGEAIGARGRFAVALSGGSTPERLYALLATAAFARRVDWPRVEVFWGDERCVPPDDPQSNYRAAREALLDHVPLPAQNVHRVRGEDDPPRAAAAYEAELRAAFPAPARAPGDAAPPRFDLILLGMGDNGHTASLFPGNTAVHERVRWVVAEYIEEVGQWRITLTPVVLNAAAQVTFLVSGSAKAARLREVLQGPRDVDALPAQVVDPVSGGLLWLVDAPAAALLKC